MNGAAQTLHFLASKGVASMFGYPGGAIMPLYDALLDFPIRHYLCRHEQGAAFAAIGHARATNEVAVCVATSGPGATNLLTSLADAKMDSVPLLVITGQVATAAMGADAFQEVDVLGLSLSVTKHSMQVLTPEALLPTLAKAFDIAQEGRPGPVLIDIPKDILTAEIDEVQPLRPVASRAPIEATTITAELVHARNLLAKSERPLLYLGGGIAMADALTECRDFIGSTGLPCVSTLKGLGTAPEHYAGDMGMLGMHGHAQANLAVQDCDLLLVLGARLDDRATGKLEAFAPNAKVIHWDIDAAEIGKRRFADVAITEDLKTKLHLLAMPNRWQAWNAELQSLKASKQRGCDTRGNQIDAPSLLQTLSETMPQRATITCDVGQHQMWVAQHMRFASPAHHLTSGGLGTMGFGLPAAIGAAVAKPDAGVIAVCGDGSFMMNVQELATVKRYALPIKILVLDNQRLGMVKQWQELFYQGRYSETDLSDNPDFCQLARVFGFATEAISQGVQVQGAIERMLTHSGPYLLHVQLSSEDNVWPIVPPNTGNHEMWEKRP